MAMRSRPLRLTSAVSPRLKARLATLEPITLPTDNPGLTIRAANEQKQTSSGADVPMLTTVSPMMRGGMLAFKARAAAPRTKSSPPPTKSASPMSSARTAGMWANASISLGMS